MEACARNLIPLQVELGGKSPQIVLPDADLTKAVPAIVRSIVMNSGQVCAAGSRVLVHSSLHDRLVSEVADAFRVVRVGLWDQPVDMGPLINAYRRSAWRSRNATAARADWAPVAASSSSPAQAANASDEDPVISGLTCTRRSTTRWPRART
jgi:acyl-CoA reductase-like NAD-dependent aldehyde dehydrogenase